MPFYRNEYFFRCFYRQDKYYAVMLRQTVSSIPYENWKEATKPKSNLKHACRVVIQERIFFSKNSVFPITLLPIKLNSA